MANSPENVGWVFYYNMWKFQKPWIDTYNISSRIGSWLWRCCINGCTSQTSWPITIATYEPKFSSKSWCWSRRVPNSPTSPSFNTDFLISTTKYPDLLHLTYLFNYIIRNTNPGEYNETLYGICPTAFMYILYSLYSTSRHYGNPANQIDR